MTWFKLDDGWLRHPKVRAAGLKGRALWTAAGLWSAEQLTDGRIPKTMLPILAAEAEIGTGKTEARRLVDAGLWDDIGDEWEFHDWHDYQPSRAEVLAERARREATSSLANHTRWHSKRGKVDPDCEHCRRSQPDPINDPTWDPTRDPINDPTPGIPPARPGPTPTLVTSEQQQSCVTRGEHTSAAAAAQPAIGRDQRTAVLEAAVAEVATRRGRYDAASTKDDPSGWLASALAGIRSELLERQAYERIHTGASATDLAELIAPTGGHLANVTPIRQGPAPVGQGSACGTCNGGHWLGDPDDPDAPFTRCPDCNPDPLDAPSPA